MTSTTTSIGVQAFAAPTTHRRSRSSSSIIKINNSIKTPTPMPACISRPTRGSLSSVVLFSGENSDDDDGNNNNKNNKNNKNNNGDKNEEKEAGITYAITQRLEQADPSEIRRDAILVTCFVLCRYFLHDISTGEKLVPGLEIQDIVYVTGTFSSAALLGLYWTAAGLLTRSFERSGGSSLLANAVNVAACCPLWIATEHLFGFGPLDIGGATLDASVANGFVGLASFMAIMKTVTRDWR